MTNVNIAELRETLYKINDEKYRDFEKKINLMNNLHNTLNKFCEKNSCDEEFIVQIHDSITESLNSLYYEFGKQLYEDAFSFNLMEYLTDK